jgi:PAS domain S-box-containing protein
MKYIIAVVAVALGAIITWLLNSVFTESSPLIIFALAVIISAWYGGFRGGFLSTILSLLTINYFFTEPTYQFTTISISEGVQLLLFALAGMSISLLSETHKRTASELFQAHEELEKRVIDLSKANLELQQVVSNREVTEKKLFQMALIAESSDDAIIGKTLDGTITSWNSAAEKIYGYSSGEIIGQSISLLIPRDRPDELPRLLSILRSGQSIKHYETTRLTKEGKLINVSLTISPLKDTRGNVTGASSIARDITDRRHSEDALRASEARFAGILRLADDAIISVNLNQRITMFNHGAERLFGYSAQDVIGQPLDLLLPESASERHRRYVSEFASSPDVSRMMAERQEISGRRKNGLEFPAEATISKVELPGETTLTVILRDITERKKVQDSLKDSLKEKELLVKEIHHRVKNNLQIVSSLLNLQSDFIKDRQALDVFRESQNRVHSMALVHEHLYQSKDLAKIDFAGYIRALIGDLRTSYGEKAKDVAVHIDTSTFFMSIDKAIPCGLIINELVSNSLKHAFINDRQGKIGVSLRKSGNEHLSISVCDDGIGFPQDIDFRQTKTLGLQLVNSLCKQLRGTLELHSENGTRFSVAIPAIKSNGEI